MEPVAGPEPDKTNIEITGTGRDHQLGRRRALCPHDHAAIDANQSGEAGSNVFGWIGNQDLEWGRVHRTDHVARIGW
jgi:hypothetical protein